MESNATICYKSKTRLNINQSLLFINLLPNLFGLSEARFPKVFFAQGYYLGQIYANLCDLFYFPYFGDFSISW